MDLFGDDGPRRTRISKTEWETQKKLHGSRCVICGQTEKQVGGLEKAHIRAHSRGGSQYTPMCANCHKKYDAGLMTATQLEKLGLTPTAYKRLQPKKKTETGGSLEKTLGLTPGSVEKTLGLAPTAQKRLQPKKKKRDTGDWLDL
jgi:hypothetical protein